jgi:flagellar biosynthesis protein FliR
MPTEAQLLSLLLGCLLVGARVAGTFAFVPFPGHQHAPNQAKIIVSIAITLALFSFWPRPDTTQPMLGLILSGVLKEAVIGVCFGLIISLVNEGLIIAFHMVGLQAGFTFASTIDPNSQADVSVLETLGSLSAGLLFFATGLHRAVLRAFAASLQAHPAGTWTLGGEAVEPILRISAMMLSAGLRLALPILASMLLIDLALALISRLNGNLHLLFLAFPVKMLASLLLIAAIAAMAPGAFGDLADRAVRELYGVIQSQR